LTIAGVTRALALLAKAAAIGNERHFNRATLAITKVLGCNVFYKNAYLLILCGKPLLE
jgi:hypothetical protein